MFPGYGSQFVGMAKELYDESRVMQEYFEEASHCLDINFVKTCFASSEAELSQIRIAYPSIFLVSCALYAMIKDRGILPDLVTGYGLGFFSALYSAGCLTFPDGLYLLRKYAQVYQEELDKHEYGVLLVSGMNLEDVQARCADYSDEKYVVAVAAQRAQMQTVIAGHLSAVEKFKNGVCGKNKVKCKKKSPGIGMHSVLMQPVADQFVAQLPIVDIKAPKVPCMDNDQAMLISAEQVQASMIKSFTHMIEWDAIMQSISAYDMIIQVGPGDQLTTLAKEQYPDKIVIAVQTADDFDQLERLITQNSFSTETE